MRRLPQINLRGTAVLLGALLSVACSKREAETVWWQGEEERIELRQQLTLKEFRLLKLGSDDLPELKELRQANKALAHPLASLRQRKLALESEVESMRHERVDFRIAIIRDQRDRATGTKLDKIESHSGRIYRDVTIASIDDAGVTIRHAHGSARLKYGDLDSGQRTFFGLDADLAAAAAEKEAGDLVAYERWIARRMVVIREKEEEQQKIARNEIAAERSRIRLASNTAGASGSRPLAQPATSVGTRYYPRYSSSYYPRRSRYYPVYQGYTPGYRNVCSSAGNYNYQYVQQLSARNQPRSRCYQPPVYSPNRTSFANTTIPSHP